MKGVHQILHQACGGRREPSKRQVYSSIAQRTWSQQRSATKQLGQQLAQIDDNTAKFSASLESDRTQLAETERLLDADRARQSGRRA
jgi:hypothetical protein